MLLNIIINANGTVSSGNGGAGGSAGGNAKQQQYIVPVDEAVLLGNTSGTQQQQQSDSSPQNMTPVASPKRTHDGAYEPTEVPVVNRGMMLMEPYPHNAHAWMIVIEQDVLFASVIDSGRQ
uniref:Uncharacterized protein n=1 Tax=Anopheles maculatus TaxID=74869 RepID=A0A182SQN5_9DIPT